ncbi:MAG: helix-turn-helix transcriptional regulator [Burkholderiales bacterium]|nr:helix-turn-helix transcriptional regulator [Burkholderiales bacterium]
MRPSKNQALINALATEIKLRRRALGFSQEDLAGHCQLDRPYISLIEVGRKQPTLSVLLRLADGLQYSMSEFMGLVQERYLLEREVATAGQ